MATTTEASVEEDEPEHFTTTTESSAEEAKEMMCLREHLRRWRQRCVYMPRELTMTTVALTEEYRLEESATTTEVSAGEEEYTKHPRDQRQRRRRQGLDDRTE